MIKVRKSQAVQLKAAKAIQKIAARLHLFVPVTYWEYEVIDKNGNVYSKGMGKANSYTRNAYNLLAWFLGMTSSAFNTSSFGDGFLGLKAVTGTVYDFATSDNIGRYPGTDVTLYLGTGTTETLDDYALPSYACITSIGSSFNSTSRKFINVISGSYQNTSGSTINVTEAGIRQDMHTNIYCLLFHDIFEAAEVLDGATIAWTYVTEIAYPNP